MMESQQWEGDTPRRPPCYPPSLSQYQSRDANIGVPHQSPGNHREVPPARSIPAHMRQIRMAPSNNRLIDSEGSFSEWDDDFHQTIPKIAEGTPRQEKTDTPKACSDSSSDRRGPEPDSSLQSIPSLLRPKPSSATLTPTADEKRGSRAEVDLFGKNEPADVCLKSGKAKARKLSLDTMPNKDDSEKSQEDDELSRMHTDSQQQPLDNKMIEELSSLPLPEDIMGEVKKTLYAVSSLLQHGVAEMGQSTLTECSSSKETGPEAEKQEFELPEKLPFEKGEGGKIWRNEFMKKMDVWPKGEPFEKSQILEMVHSLSQQNRLTNRVLTHIYSCYRDQGPVAFKEQEPNSKQWKEFVVSLRRSMSECSPSLLDGKEGKHSLMSECEMDSKEGVIDDPTAEHHLSELSVEDLPPYPFRLPMEPVENSFYSFGSTYCNTTHLTKLAESLTFCPHRIDLKEVLRSLIYSVFASGFEKRAKMEIKPALTDKEMLNQLHTEAEKDEKKNAAEEKPLKTEVSEPSDCSNMETDEEKSHSVTETVFEKSDFEEPEEAAPAKLKPSSTTSLIPATEEEEKTAQEVSVALQLSTRREANQTGRGRKGSKPHRKKKELDQALHADTVKVNISEGRGCLKSCRGPVRNLLKATKKLSLEKAPENEDDVIVPAAMLHNSPPRNRQEEDQSHQTVDVTHNRQVSVLNDSITHQNPPPWRSPNPQKMTTKVKPTKKDGKTKQTMKKKRSQNCKKKTSIKVQRSTAATSSISLVLAKGRVCHSLPLRILKPQLTPVVRKQKNHFPGRPGRVDVRGAGATVKTTSGGTEEGSKSSGQGGNSTNSSNQGGGSRGQGWGGARPKSSRNNNGDKDGDDEEEENKRPRQNIPGSLAVTSSVETPRGGDPPPPNFKRHRKKQHGSITNEQLCHCLGQAGLGIHVLRQSSGAGELDRCLLLCLHETNTVTSPTLEDLTCCTCAILHSLLSHFTTAAHGRTCPMCLQLFTLVLFHVQECLAGRRDDEDGEDSSRNVCHKMRQAGMFADSTVTASSPKVWTKMRKYLSAALGPVLLLDMGVQEEEMEMASLNHQEQSLPCSADSVAQHAQQGPATLSQTLEGTPQAVEEPMENAAVPWPNTATAAVPQVQGSPDATQSLAAVMPKAAPGCSSLRRRPSTRVIPQKTIPEESSATTPPAFPAAEEREEVIPPNLVEVGTLPSAVQHPACTPEESEEMMVYIRRFAVSRGQLSRQAPDDPWATQRTYGPSGTISMPERRDRLIVVEQNLSMEMKPTGMPGIGEVVYGTRQQLRIVAKNWRQERDECKASGHCRYQHREEGVILHPFKTKLKILHTRYQKHHQWERLVHLGNGVTGKCHLCIDRTSNFRFCCKKVHILHYEDQELDIWSELDHPNIVRFYGAIRHGEKIYMFAEVVDGGSLAALIKEQLTVHRRLSHWTAINYFRQLLQVLTYLQSMGVLHEDIKADNLLVRDGTTEIVLADFGAAQQIPHDHAPPNRFPTGSPAHWSPEKAASEGHGFPSDLWASACVLIHMLSGSPPWIRRYPDAAILNFIIWSRPPPMEDVPDNVKESVRDLISCCLVKDKAIRPTAQQMLAHPAFQLLDQSGSFFSIFAQPGVGLPSDLATSGPATSGSTASGPTTSGHTASGPATSGPNASGHGSYRPQQTLLQPEEEGAVGGINPSIGTPVLTVSRVMLSASVTVSEVRSAVAVVESPCSSLDNRAELHQPRPSSSTGPQQEDVLMQQQVSAIVSLTQVQETVQQVKPVGNASSHQQEKAAQKGQAARGNAGLPVHATSVANLPLHPEPWPDVPPLALTTGSLVIQRANSVIGSNSPGHPSLTAPSVCRPGGRGTGPTSLPAGNPGGVAPPASPQMTPWVSATTRRVLASTTISSTQGQTGLPSRSAGQGDGLNNRVSHGTSVGSLHLQRMEQSPLSKQSTWSSSTASSVANTRQLVETPQNRCPVPGRLLTIPPPDDGVDQSIMAPGAASVTLQTGSASDPTSGMQPTSGNSSTGVASVMPNIAVFNPAVHQALDPGQQALQLPEYPELTVEDFQVAGRGHGTVQLPPFLSMIPESAEQESLSPSAQQSVSDGSSSGHMWNYMQDQFSDPTETQQHLVQTSGSRPMLQLYNYDDGAGAESSLQQQLKTLPKFDLISNSLADYSTIKSGRNESSSGETITPEFQAQPQAPAAGSIPVSGVGHAPGQAPFMAQTTLDEPDLTHQLASGGRNAADTQVPDSQPGRTLARGNSDEDRISSGDMFGSGPSTNPDFEEALQYRQRQPGPGDEEQPLRCQQQPSPPSPSAFPQAHTAPSAASPHMSKKNPNLRLDVTQPTVRTSTPSRVATSSNRRSQGGEAGQASQSTLGDSGCSTHTQLQGEEDAFFFSTGISPLTASPMLVSSIRPHDARPRSRNESGSSVSTPRSSTYDKQEQEWTTLQRQTPGFDNDMLLAEEPMIMSGSEHSSSHHLSLMADPQGEASVSDQEESSMLSFLQERISEQQFGGQRLVFKDPQGHFLFDMRVLGHSKGWKELAVTFRGKICKAGVSHFKLVHQDGQTPVDYFSTYDPAVTSVLVVGLSEDLSGISSTCWCENHLIY